MNLARRSSTDTHLQDRLLGARVVARPPTIRKSLVGTVIEIDGYTLALRQADGMIVAVDVEDCSLLV